MIRLGTLQRRIGGFLVACLAVMFLAGPLIDSAVCATDGIPVAASTIYTAGTMAVADRHADPAHAFPGVCQHGHAHAAAAFIQITAPCTAPAAVLVDALHPPLSRLPAFLVSSGQDRPPRA